MWPGGFPKIIGVVSHSRGVGRSTISLNLALALSNAGYKTLLIDTDTENPELCQLLGIKPGKLGFSDILTGKAKPGETVSKYSANLYVMRGSYPANPVKLTAMSVLRIAVMSKAFLTNKYDFVVTDNVPPMPNKRFPIPYDTLIVSTPAALRKEETQKLKSKYELFRVPNDLVINMVKPKDRHLASAEMEEVYGNYILMALPYTKRMEECAIKKRPIYLSDRDSAFSRRIRKMAMIYIGRRMGVKGLEKKPALLRKIRKVLEED